MVEDMIGILADEGFREGKRREPGELHADKYR